MKSFKDINQKETDLEEKACWVGYKKVGMKKKGDRMVPNCVKEEVVNEVYGKDWVYEEPTNENVGDMYKGKLSAAQLTNLKNLWKNKRQSDVTPSVKSYVKGLDQFTKMDIKQANIKYLSNLIDSVQKEEVDFITPLKEQIEIVEMNSVVRKTDLKEFNSDQIERLAKAYSMMKDRTISVDNAKRLVKMMDGVPVGSLNALRKKKIPFLSGLAMTRMIKLKMPITETYTVQITKKDGSKMSLGRYNTSAEAQRYVDQYGAGAKIVKEDLNKEEVAIVYTDKKTRQVVSKKFKNDSEARKFIKQFDGAAGQINFKPSSMLNKEDLDKKDVATIEPIIKQLQKSVTAHGKQAKQLKKDISDDKDLEEADLSKSQVTKVHKQADDLPKKDFMKRYGKDGDAVRYATATNMVKKKLGIGEDNKLITKGELKMNESYKLKLNSAMEHYKIASLAELKDEDQKAFFSYVDGLDEGLSAGQKKLPPALQKAILAKQGKKDDKKDEMHDMKKDDKKEIKEEDAYENDRYIIKNGKATLDNSNTPDKKNHVYADGHKDAEKKAKEKGIKEDEMKTEMMAGKMNAMKEPMNAMKMNAMKMPIRAMKKMEDLVGGQKKLDKDKDGDLDAKDFAALRKTKSEAVKTGEADAEPKVKELNAMVKSSHKPDHKGNPIDDMNAGYMKSNVKAPVTNKGGADMAVVKDAPKMVAAMAKISNEKKMMNMKAMYGESRENAKRYLDTKPGSVEEAVLISRGLIEKKKALVEARWEIEGKVSYKGIGNEDAFHMIINANSEKDAEDKAEDELTKARQRRKIGPGGGGNIDYMEVEGIEKTNKSLSAPETYYPGN